jgi:SET domain-containing protein
MLVSSIDIKDHSYASDYYVRGNLFSVDAKKAGNFSRFVNHSGNPNINVFYHNTDGIWYAVFIANTFIKKDEQLFVNYGSSYWGDTKPIALH